MLRSLKGRLSFANVISMTALFIVLGAGAYAAAKIDSGDIKNSTIVSKDIKNKKGVKGKDVKDGSIKGADIGDGSVAGADVADKSIGAADLTDDEAAHAVGAAGEPAFSNGGEGDCVFSNIAVPPPVTPSDLFNPVSFYKDKTGRVHLSGAFAVANGSGGDATCGDENPEDLIVFTLPASYQPAHLELQSGSDGATAVPIVINGTRDVAVGGVPVIPAGVVAVNQGVADGDEFVLDGISWRASAGAPATKAKTAPAVEVAPSVVEGLLGG